MLASVTLIQMNVTPVVAVHVPFGGDNHRDIGLGTETAQTVSGVATIASLMQQLGAAGLADRVSFVSLNVFGRTLGPGNGDGRQHNPNHQVSLTIGKPFRGGILGAVAPVQNDYGAAIDAKTGQGGPDGDVARRRPWRPSGAPCWPGWAGVDQSASAADLPSGQVIGAALA